MKILHVEDNPADHAFVAFFLPKEYELVHVLDALRGMEALAEDDFDFVLLDWMLLRGNGAQLEDFLSENEIPFAYVSGLDREVVTSQTTAQVWGKNADDMKSLAKDLRQRTAQRELVPG